MKGTQSSRLAITVLIVAFALLTGCEEAAEDGDGGGGGGAVIGIWIETSSVEGTDTSTFPKDILDEYLDLADHDIDEDGQDEAYTVGTIHEITETQLIPYNEYIWTDPGDVMTSGDIDTWLAGFDTGYEFHETGVYELTDETWDAVIDGDSITITKGTEEMTFTWTVVGDELTLESADMTLVYDRGSESDIEGAVPELE